MQATWSPRIAPVVRLSAQKYLHPFARPGGHPSTEEIAVLRTSVIPRNFFGVPSFQPLASSFLRLLSRTVVLLQTLAAGSDNGVGRHNGLGIAALDRVLRRVRVESSQQINEHYVLMRRCSERA